MRLKKLSIFGFKSFADKTELTFGEGMTSIIGPNGSGKSNIVDAIRWVFGEQKASSLRSSNMQDVIFSGTQHKKPLNMAEVTITITNEDGRLPIEYNEVSLTRRIFRSGESEYLINKAPSRLKDIHNIFLDTGLGSNAYTTISNDMIDKILSNKADERRVLFEEAAGIGKYKQKIKESQRKLERTRQDLLRINDRIGEKEKYVKMLGRQVEKAKRYQQYHEELKTLEVGFEYKKYKALSDAVKNEKERISNLDKNTAELQKQIAETESRIEKLEVSKVEKSNEVKLSSQNVTAVSEKINTIDREMSVTTQALAMLEKSIGSFDQETEDLQKQIDEKEKYRTELETAIVEKQTGLDQHSENVQNAKDEYDSFNSRVISQKEIVEELAEKQMALVQSIGECKRESSNCNTNVHNLIEACEREEHEITRLREADEEYTTALNKCKDDLKELNSQFKQYSEERDGLWYIIEEEDKRYHTLLEREKKIEANSEAAQSKLQFLEGLDASFEGYDDGVKSLFERDTPGLIGTAASLIKIDKSESLPLIERVIGHTIQTVLMENNTTLYDAASFLQNESRGNAELVSLEMLRKKDKPTWYNQVLVDTQLLKDDVSIDNDYKPFLDYMFDNIYKCNNHEQIRQYQVELPSGIIMVTNDLVVYHSNGAIFAGEESSNEGSLLKRKQEIETLNEEIVSLQGALAKTMNEKEACVESRDNAKRSMVELDSKLNKGRQELQEQETNIKHYESNIENTHKRINILLPDLTEKKNNITKLEEQLKEFEKKLESLEEDKEALAGQNESAKSKLSEMETERVELSEKLQTIELSKQAYLNEIQKDQQSIDLLKQDIDKLSSTKQKKIDDKINAGNEIESLKSKSVNLSEEFESQKEYRETLQKEYETKQEEYNTLLSTIEEIRKETKIYQSELSSYSTSKHSAEINFARDEEKKRAIQEKIFTAYEIDFESLEEDIPEPLMDDSNAKETIRLLHDRLKRVGEVNMGAIKEFETENGELQEMVSQRDDLQTAVDDLEQAIKKLNKEARKQFVETFDLVQKNFTEMFTTLFRGGEAMISLEEGADPLYSPIEINVRPAGKKMRGVTLLSGGERALTAISLLFGLYMVKPSAYCILDELDAPLDDANVKRFIDVLRPFSEQSQFIIITHNHITMESSDVLYGVTQKTHGVSSVAAVRFNDDNELEPVNGKK